MEFIKIEGQQLIVASDNKGYIYLMNINKNELLPPISKYII